MTPQHSSFSEKQALTLIYMAEGFQAAARTYPDFPWGAVAFRQSWFMYEALPVLERTARMANKETAPDMLAAAAVLGGAIAKYAWDYDGLPAFAVLSVIARDAVGYESDEEIE